MYDCHTHTFFSDGELGPAELIRRAEVLGLEGIAITDHVDSITLAPYLEKMLAGIDEIRENVGIEVLVGCELTHVPPSQISALIDRARSLGAEIIGVHGESPVEPVAEGTNRAALETPELNFLAHPGFIMEKELELAARNDIYLEITARGGHSLTNGYLVSRASEKNIENLIVSTDAHAPSDLIDHQTALQVVKGAGYSRPEEILKNNEKLFMEAKYA